MSIKVTPKDPDRDATYSVDVFQRLVTEAFRSNDFEVDDLVRAPRDTGLYYKCTKAGRTAYNFPTYPVRENEKVIDGSSEWIALHPSTVTAITIQTVVWSVPAALTLESQVETNHRASVTLSGGVDGADYEVTATINPTEGDAFDTTLIVPVRNQ